MATRTPEEIAEIKAQMALADNNWEMKEKSKKNIKAAREKTFKMKMRRDEVAAVFNEGVAKAAAKIHKSTPQGAGYEYQLISKGYRRESFLEQI